jgi:hypothetical protein
MKVVWMVVLFIFTLTAAVFAASPHFVDSKTTAAIQLNGGLVVQFKESGLGDAATSYILSATAAVTCNCVNKGGNCPEAANKMTFNKQVSATGTFSPKNGTVDATLILSAPPCPISASPTCGTGQHFEMSKVAWTSINLLDITNAVKAKNLPSGVSTTLFVCP